MPLWTRALDQPKSLRARGWLFQIHLWLGLIVGLYAVAIGVTGSVLMFHEELLDRVVHGAEHVQPGGTPRPIEDWAATVRTVTGHKGGVNITLPESPSHAARAMIYNNTGMQLVMVNPYDASALRHYRHRGTLLQLVEQFHSNFFLARTGRVLNGFGGLSLVLLAITGLLIWWPGRGRWTRLTRIDVRASWKRINWDLHHSIGFWAWTGFVLISFTGVYFTWPQSFRSAISSVAPLSAPPKPVRITPQGDRLPIANLLQTAAARLPELRTVAVEVPANPRDPLRVIKHGDGPRRYRTQSTILIDPYRGDILRVDDARARTTGDVLLSWVPTLHAGSFGGLPVKIIYAALGLVFPLLFVTGFVMWWLRVVRKQLLNYDAAREATNAKASSLV